MVPRMPVFFMALSAITTEAEISEELTGLSNNRSHCRRRRLLKSHAYAFKEKQGLQCLSLVWNLLRVLRLSLHGPKMAAPALSITTLQE